MKSAAAPFLPTQFRMYDASVENLLFGARGAGLLDSSQFSGFNILFEE
jgi:hypothetical protein